MVGLLLMVPCYHGMLWNVIMECYHECYHGMLSWNVIMECYGMLSWNVIMNV